MRIAIASDHAAVLLKTVLADWLRDQGHEVLDLGTDGNASVDYPDFGRAVGEALADGRAERGVALCGSGIGISIAANRNPACRCALVSEPLSAALARQHNDANAIAMGARVIGRKWPRPASQPFCPPRSRADVISAVSTCCPPRPPRIERQGYPHEHA